MILLINFNRYLKYSLLIFSNIEKISNDLKIHSNGNSIRLCFFSLNRKKVFFSREKETNEKYLRAIEEDQERDMRQLEDKIRQEVRIKTYLFCYLKKNNFV